jgi:hypothetical protein
MGGSVAILTALYDALVTALDVQVWSTVPQASDGGAAAAFPYVRIGAIAIVPWDTHSETGHDFTVRLHTRWRGASEDAGRIIQDAIYAALHNGELLIDGGSTVLLQRQSTTVLALPDGDFDGVCEYRGLIESI